MAKLDTEMKLLFGALVLLGVGFAFKGSKFDKIERKVSPGHDYLITYSVNPPLPSNEAIDAFKQSLINSGAKSVVVTPSGGSYVIVPDKDDTIVLHATILSMNVQGKKTSVIVNDVKEV